MKTVKEMLLDNDIQVIELMLGHVFSGTTVSDKQAWVDKYKDDADEAIGMLIVIEG